MRKPEDAIDTTATESADAEDLLLIGGYIESHGQTRFTIQDVSDDTGVAWGTCRRVLLTHPYIQRLHYRGKGESYLSTAPKLEATPEGEWEVLMQSAKSRIGKEAVQDYYDVIDERRTHNKNHKVSQRY